MMGFRARIAARAVRARVRAPRGERTWGKMDLRTTIGDTWLAAWRLLAFGSLALAALASPGCDNGAPRCQAAADCAGENVCASGRCAAARLPVVHDFALSRPTADGVDENILVNGRLIRPVAPSIRLGTFATRLALHPGGRFAAVNENGFGTIRTPEDHDNKEERLRIVDLDAMKVVQEVGMQRRSMHLGLRWDAAGSLLYVAGGYDRTIQRYRFGADGRVTFDRLWELHDCYTTDIVLAPDEKRLYTSCFQQSKVARLDLSSGAQLDIEAGHEPYTLALTPDGRRLFAANISTVPQPANGDTVTALDVERGTTIGAIHVGLAPEGMVLAPDGRSLYVACNKTDEVIEIDAVTLAVKRRISLLGDAGALKGIYPTLLTLAPDAKTLYVAGAGENLVAVVDLATGTVRGSIPTEWYPTDVALSRDAKTLYVLNGKGRGDGPRTDDVGPNGLTRNDPVGRQLFASILKTPVPSGERLAELTAIVAENNDRQSRYFDLSGGNDTALPSPDAAGRSPIRHVFFIIKENFSYDSAYGDLGKGDGEPSYTLWGEEVIPNQRKLAREFTLFDNFYCDAESSIDGHQWAAAGIEPDWVEKVWILGYAGFGFPDPAVSLTPGTIPESRFFMPHLIEQGIHAYGFGGAENFGLGLLNRYRGNILLDYPFLLDAKFKDHDRAVLFQKEFGASVANGTVPAFSWIFLPNNHAFGLSVGQLVPESWVADNDDAVGIVLDTIAHSPVWESSLVFIVEDDSQSGYDHVEKHRCPMVAIGPWVKRNYTSSVQYSMPNIHKTIELILGSAPMHRWDAKATGLYDVFTARADTTPFTREVRRFPDVVYPGPENELTALSSRLDWTDIDKNPEAAELYWRYRKGTPPPVVPNVVRERPDDDGDEAGED